MTFRLRALLIALIVADGLFGFAVGLYGRALYDDGWPF